MISFFMGANTRNGFYSLFDTVRGVRDVSVVKGTSGSGKSTFLKTLMRQGRERILCSSDHASLDGVIAERKAIFDGTAPHVCEPTVAGKYVLMPNCDLSPHKEELARLRDGIKKDYDAAYSLTAAAADARDAARALLLPAFRGDRFLKRADGVLKRVKNPRGETRFRFIDSLCAEGVKSLAETVSELASRITVVEDSFGLADGFFEILKEGFRGTDCYVCPSPIDPLKTRHIILPALGLAFVTSDELCRYDGPRARVVRETSYIDKNAAAACKYELKLLKKLENELLCAACKKYGAAKEKHKALEAVIRPHLDTDALNKIAEEYKTILD